MTVEARADGKFDLSITTTMEQIPKARERLSAAMKKACGQAGVADISDPLIINTNDVPMRFIVMQTITCKPNPGS